MIDQELIIKNLRAYRVKAGLTQAEFGKKTGMHPVMISQYEGSKHMPRGQNLSKILAVLKVLFPEGLPILDGPHGPDGGRPAGSVRVICGHCGAANHHYVEEPIKGLEIRCIACSRPIRPNRQRRRTGAGTRRPDER